MKPLLSLLLSLLALPLTLGLSACSSDDDDEGSAGATATAQYHIAIAGSSPVFKTNAALQAEVDALMEASGLDKTCTQAEATTWFSQTCSTIVQHDWAWPVYGLREASILTLSLQKEGLEVTRRSVSFPKMCFGLLLDHESTALANNHHAHATLTALIDAVSPSGKVHLDLSEAEADSLFSATLDSIRAYRWKTNEMALLPGSSFTLHLVYGEEADAITPPDLDHSSHNALRSENVKLN